VEEIIIAPLVYSKLTHLVDSLFNTKYFAMKDNAHQYANDIFDFIQTIPNQRHRPTKNTKYGAWNCEYKPNRRTSWFITFDKNEEVYLVKNLMNNHTKEYPAYIRGF
jgi:hypothetical protein